MVLSGALQEMFMIIKAKIFLKYENGFLDVILLVKQQKCLNLHLIHFYNCKRELCLKTNNLKYLKTSNMCDEICFAYDISTVNHLHCALL